LEKKKLKAALFLSLQNINNKSVKYWKLSPPVKAHNVSPPFALLLLCTVPFCYVLYLFAKEYMVFSCLALLLCGRFFIPINSIMPPLLTELDILSLDAKTTFQRFPVILYQS